MKRYRLSEPAIADLDSIWSHVAQDNIGAADRLISKLIEKFQLLGEFPKSGRLREDLLPALRCHPVGKYLIFFKPVKKGIEIVRVVHGARDYPKLFGS